MMNPSGGILDSIPGEMARRVRERDWSGSPLGPESEWPQSLRLVSALCLHSRLPMFIWWGPELINLYNDAFIPILGARHPGALGRRAPEVWPEIWQVVAPQVKAVVERRESTRNDRVWVVVDRDGTSAEVCSTWSYTPIYDEGGEVGGVLCAILEPPTAGEVGTYELPVGFAGVALDVTARKEAEGSLPSSEAKYRMLFDSMDEGFCIVEVIFDGDRPVDCLVLEHNPAFLKQSGFTEAAGRTVRELLPDVEDSWLEMFGRVARTGRAVRVESEVRGLGRWFDAFAFPADDSGGGNVALLFNDITAQRDTAAELSRSRERLRAVLENSLDAAYRRDLHTDTYDYLSPRVEHVLGIDLDRMQTMPLEMILDRIHPDDRADVARVMEEGTALGRGRVEYRFRTDEGDYRWLADHFTIQSDEDGRPRFRTGTVRDASERKRTEAALQEAKDQAEQASQAKSQFLAVMSHELRTPLTGIIGFADLMENEVLGPATARQKESLARLKAGAWHLIGIIDEILTLSRGEAGREEVRWREADIAELTRDVIRIAEPEAAAQGLLIGCIDLDEPIVLRTDPGKVRRILINLVGNAIKYGGDGWITVQLDRSDPRMLHVRVRDTGQGIASAEHERIFEPFTQLDSTHTRTAAGAGLGLAICRRLARLLGGEVTVVSAEGKGSTFTLALPTPDAQG